MKTRESHFDKYITLRTPYRMAMIELFGENKEKWPVINEAFDETLETAGECRRLSDGSYNVTLRGDDNKGLEIFCMLHELRHVWQYEKGILQSHFWDLKDEQGFDEVKVWKGDIIDRKTPYLERPQEQDANNWAFWFVNVLTGRRNFAH